MRIEYVYTLHTKFEDIIKDLDEKLRVDFEPKFFFLFLTESTWKLYKRILGYLKKKFPNCQMAGCIVEGYVTDEGIWTRGLALLFFECGVEVFWARGKTAEETFTRLKEKMGTGWSSAIVMFPLFRFGSRLSMLNFALSNNVIWRYRYGRAKDLRDKYRILKAYSKRLESQFAYPTNKALSVFDGEFPIIGLNLLPLKAEIGTPLIIANYEELGRSAVAVCFKGKTNAVFHDVFPERGKSFDETFEIIKSMMPSAMEVDVIKNGIAIGEVNSIAPVDFLKKMKHIRIYERDETIKMLEDGKFKTVSPYGLAFISKETFGSSWLGLLPYSIRLYPSLFDLDSFYDKALFIGEYFKGGIRAFRGLFEVKKFNDSFDFFVIDANVIPMFAGRCFEIKRMANELCYRYFGILTMCISFRFNKLSKSYFSEIQKGLCFNVTGTSTMLEIKSLK